MATYNIKQISLPSGDICNIKDHRILGITDNTSATAVTNSDNNVITARTLYYAGYTKNTGTVTSITPGNGLINGTTGSSQSAITSSGTISIKSGGVTNDMLAGSIANNKLTNSSITIAGKSVSLGSSITLEQMGLSNAMHFCGIATVAITDGSSTDPEISGYTFSSALAGDVVIDKDSSYEYVWSGSVWEKLGGDSSYSLSTHTHGNITNDGKITTTTSIGNGDGLVITDSSSSNKLVSTTITFDGSTATKALTQKGTWETFNNYSLPVAKYNTLGGVKPLYTSTNSATPTTAAATNTTTPTIEAKSTTSNRYYGIEADKNGILFVNVPWTSTATEFSSNKSITLTGDVTGSASSTGGWSIATSIGSGKVTNSMLAGSIEKDKLVNTVVKVFTRNDIGTSPNFDNPGVNGFFEVRASSETTGESGTKPFSGYGGILSLKTADNVTIMQLAGRNSTGWRIRGNQGTNVTLSGIDWQQLVTNTSSTQMGSATKPIYINSNGQVIEGTALKNLAYIDKPSNNQTATWLRGDGTWVLKTALVGQTSNNSTSLNTNNWYKVATTSMDTTYTDYNITFYVEDTYYSTDLHFGILRAQTRINGDKKIERATLEWEYNTGFDCNDFVLAYSSAASPTIEIWTRIIHAYKHRRFTVLSEGQRTTANETLWTLEANNTSNGSESAPTNGYVQVVSVNRDLYANKFYGDGSNITSLNATNITSGTISADRLPTIPSNKLTLPVASDTQSGIVSTSSQIFAGNKTIYGSTISISNISSKYDFLEFKTRSGTSSRNSNFNEFTTPEASVAQMIVYQPTVTKTYSNATSTTVTSTAYQRPYIQFRIYAFNSELTSATGYYENYSLPTVNDNLLDYKSYTILTTKNTVTVAQGGTGASSFTANQVIMSGNSTTAALTTRALTNNTSNTTITSGTNIPTMNTLYYGLATINNATQSRATSIYAPTSAGTANYILISSGGTSAPVWTNHYSFIFGNRISGTTTTVGSSNWGVVPSDSVDVFGIRYTDSSLGTDAGDWRGWLTQVSSTFVTFNMRIDGTMQASSFIGNASTATKLSSAKYLAVALGSTTSASFDGSANQLSIPVSGTLAIANGGTGATSAVGAKANLNLGTAAMDFRVENFNGQYQHWGIAATVQASNTSGVTKAYVNKKTALLVEDGGLFCYDSTDSHAVWALTHEYGNEALRYYRRSVDNTTICDWRIVYKTYDSNDVGSATNPVYITATGAASACSYSLGASVPSTAVFTDEKVKQTNTSSTYWRKVMLGNHTSSSSDADHSSQTTEIFAAKYISAHPSTGALRAEIYQIANNVKLQYNSTDNSLDFVFI